MLVARTYKGFDSISALSYRAPALEAIAWYIIRGTNRGNRSLTPKLRCWINPFLLGGEGPRWDPNPLGWGCVPIGGPGVITVLRRATNRGKTDGLATNRTESPTA